MTNLNSYTFKQLIIAAGLSRKLTRREISRVSDSNLSYLTRLLKLEDFHRLIDMFDNLPVDKDTQNYSGLGTLYADIGRLVYGLGEKLIRDETKTL